MKNKKKLQEKIYFRSIPYIFLLFFIFSQSYSQSWMDDYKFKFGIIKKSRSGKYIIMRETKRIPLDIKNQKNFYFGFSINSSHIQDFSIHSVLYPPENLKYHSYKTGEPVPSEIPPARPGRKHIISRCGIFPRTFNRNDVAGRYKLIVYINNKPVRAFYFNVYGSSRRKNYFRLK